MEAGNHLRGSTKCLRELSLTSPSSDAGSVTPLYYTNETLYMIRAKYLVFHLAKTQQNIIFGCLINSITLVLSPPSFLSHTHTLCYNLTFQKHVSGFQTHKTSPAVKGIHVWIVLFVLMTFINVHYNVLHVVY